jgi:Rha family phage regulatory protein
MLQSNNAHNNAHSEQKPAPALRAVTSIIFSARNFVAVDSIDIKTAQEPAATFAERQMDSVVKLEDGKLVTDSMTIAKSFGKQHEDVIRAIRNIDCSNEFSQRNFARCYRINRLANGKPVPYYEITLPKELSTMSKTSKQDSSKMLPVPEFLRNPPSPSSRLKCLMPRLASLQQPSDSSTSDSTPSKDSPAN